MNATLSTDVEADSTSSAPWFYRLGFAALILVAATVLARVMGFILEQSTSVFRNLSLHPITLLDYAPAGLVAGALAYLLGKRVTHRHLVIACLAVLAAGLAWWGIQHEPLSGLLLPEPLTK